MVETDCPVWAATDALSTADWVLIGAGAGFGADSGLLTYEECRASGIAYDDLCRPELLYEDPFPAYEFWSRCLREYRSAPPHHGYVILNRLLRDRAAKGRVYVYTSNVDGHFRHFPSLRLFEIHGCLEEWVCSSRSAYRAGDFEEGSAGSAGPVPLADVPLDGPRWSKVREQQSLMSKSPCKEPVLVRPPPDWGTEPDLEAWTAAAASRPAGAAAEPPKDGVSWSYPTPKCACGLPLRPSVLMFADYDPPLLQRLRRCEEAYQRWEAVMEAQLAASGGHLVILELGCGTRVPSVRRECECVMRDATAKGVRATLVRVNPAEAVHGIASFEDGPGRLITITMRALDALCAIDLLLQEKERHGLALAEGDALRSLNVTVP